MSRVEPRDVRFCEHMARGLMRQAREHLRSGADRSAESTTRHARVWWREANRLRRISSEA